MGINFKAVKAALKAANLTIVQYDKNGGFVEVCDGTFIARMTPDEYTKNGFVSALGAGLPTDKAMALRRDGKKGEYRIEPRIKSENMMLVNRDAVTARATKVYYGLSNGSLARIYKLASGKAVFIAEALADIISDCNELVGSKKYGPITALADGEPIAMVLPVRAEFEEVCKDLDFNPTPVELPKSEPVVEEVEEEPEEVEEEVEDEPLEAPEIATDCNNDETETEEVTDEIDELDDVESIKANTIQDGEEEPADRIEGFGEVPADCVYKVRTNGTEWIYGNTKPIKDGLKACGFHWAPHFKGASPKKSAWYRKPEMVAVENAAD